MSASGRCNSFGFDAAAATLRRHRAVGGERGVGGLSGAIRIEVGRSIAREIAKRSGDKWGEGVFAEIMWNLVGAPPLFNSFWYSRLVRFKLYFFGGLPWWNPRLWRSGRG